MYGSVFGKQTAPSNVRGNTFSYKSSRSFMRVLSLVIQPLNTIVLKRDHWNIIYFSILTSVVKNVGIIHTLPLDAALRTASLCLPNCQEPANDSALQKGTARSTLARLPPSPESHAQSAPAGFHTALRQKPPPLWQEAPAKAMAMVFPASVSSCIALSISTPIFAVSLQSMMVSPICFTLFWSYT